MIGAAYIGSQRANSRILLSTTTMHSPTTSYTIPSGAVYIEADLYGGGGGGAAGFYSSGGRGGTAVISSGNGGGGGSRVQHRHVASMTSGDLINVTLGGSIPPGGVGNLSRLNTHTRSGTTIFTFSPAPVAQGGGGGGGANNGGVGYFGNLSNQNGNTGVTGTTSATVAQNGGDGGNPVGASTKGLGGLHATNTPPTAGTTPGGGGGGGYAKSGASYGGASGGGGQITMKAYG